MTVWPRMAVPFWPFAAIMPPLKLVTVAVPRAAIALPSAPVASILPELVALIALMIAAWLRMPNEVPEIEAAASLTTLTELPPKMPIPAPMVPELLTVTPLMRSTADIPAPCAPPVIVPKLFTVPLSKAIPEPIAVVVDTDAPA